jgi:hypothetical protein
LGTKDVDDDRLDELRSDLQERKMNNGKAVILNVDSSISGVGKKLADATVWMAMSEFYWDGKPLTLFFRFESSGLDLDRSKLGDKQMFAVTSNISHHISHITHDLIAFVVVIGDCCVFSFR